MARNTAFYLARKHTDLSLQQIGSQFNRRHSTVLKGITNVEREISRQSPVGRQLGAAMQKLRT
jgi:chromosomal replication initiator protein